VAVAGNYAYVADLAGLAVVDISKPAMPAIVGGADTPGQGFLKGVAVAGNYAYVADGSSMVVGPHVVGSFVVVDVSNPTSPILVRFVATLAYASGVAVVATHAYIADDNSGLQVVDISNPASAAIVGSVDTPGYALGVAVAGTHAYVADAGSGLQILPAQCPATTPVEISSFEAIPQLGAILVTWATSFESEHLGFHVSRSMSADAGYVRVSSELIEPPGPYRFLDAEVRPGATYFYRLEALDRSGGHEFYGPLEATALATAGLRRYTLSQNYPNPFVAGQGGTAIEFVLEQRGPANLCIFDATGRLVRVLVDQPLNVGPHAVSWDGRNDGGTDAASGSTTTGSMPGSSQKDGRW
jgi:hypothetical protein